MTAPRADALATATSAAEAAPATGDDVRLHPLRWWHLADAHALEQRLFADAWTQEQLWSELAGVPETRWYVGASLAGRLVGYAGLFVAGTDADVQTVAVDPDVQGRGAGRALLGALLAEAARRGCSRVTLEVRSDNDRAIELYRRHGFERIGVRRGYYPSDGTDAHVMQRRLAPGEVAG